MDDDEISVDWLYGLLALVIALCAVLLPAAVYALSVVE